MKLVYLDHCVVSNLSRDAARSWRDVSIGKVLSKAIDGNRARVYASPTEVMEVALTAKFDDSGNVSDATDEEKGRLDLRMRVAKNLLEMIEGQWMCEAYEFIVVREFLDNLEKLAPGAVADRSHFDMVAETHRQVFLGMLGLFASYRPFGGASGILKMQRAKLTSRLLHSRFAKNPSQFVDKLVDCARAFRTTTDDIWIEHDSRSVSDIRQEIEDNHSQSVVLDPRTKARLQRDKQMIAEAYGSSELAEAIVSVFGNVIYLLLTFDMEIIKSKWGDIVGNAAAKPPASLGPEGERCSEDLVARINALQTLFRVFARDRLFVSQLPTSIILSELELCLAQEEIPTGGLTFDSQHAAMLTRVHLFVTQDERLANTARRAAAKINATGAWQVRIVTNEGELANELD